MKPSGLALALLLSLAGCAESAAPAKSAAAPAQNEERAAAAMLDDWHVAAARADEPRYFGHFAKEAVYLGTDATERWDVPAFRTWARPYFEKGKAWTFRATRRAVRIAPGGNLAWFDEDLVTDGLGPARGSGVLVREGGTWKIAHYDLSIPIPNERLDGVRAVISEPPKPPLRERYKAAYERASTVALTDLREATKLLADLVPEAKTRPFDDLEFWLHNELTWLHWAQDDLPGALHQVDAMRATLDHALLPADKSDKLRLHERWDRAYILLEMALRGPADKRAKALAEAQQARASYDTLAKANEDHEGMAALGTFFAARLGKKKEALEFARKVDITKRDDVQDLYVFQLAYAAGGDKATTEATRTRICTVKNYLMRPLILRQAAREGWSCPGSQP